MIIYLQMIESDEGKAKFERIYVKYKGFMYHIAFKNVKQNEDAEDVMHQAFIRIIKDLDKLGAVDSKETMAYIAMVCDHCAIDFLRKKKKYTELPLEVIDERQFSYVPNEDNIREAVLKLPPHYRNVIFLHYFFGFSEKEIAKKMGVRNDSARRTLHKARIALCKILEEDGER